MSKLYLRNIRAVLMGTVVSQLIPVLASLILARQFSPSEFGVYSSWLGVTIFVSVCLTGRFETALPMEEDGQNRASAVVHVVATTLIFSVVPLLILVSLFLIGIKSIGLIPLKFLMISLAVSLLTSFIQIWQTWAAAEGFYKKLSLIRIAQAALLVSFQLLIGFAQPSPLGLIWGHFFGAIFSFLMCIVIMPLRHNFKTFGYMNELLDFWKINKKFPFFSLPADATNAAAGQLPLLLIASKFGVAAAGYYALTIRVLGAPIGLLGSSALDVFKRHAAIAYRTRGECAYEYMHTFKILSLATILTSVLFFFLVKPIFLVAYGEGWSMSGKIAIWLIPLFAFRFVASPLSYMVYIAGKQHFDLFWQICLIGVTFLSLNYVRDFDEAIKLYSFGYASLYLIYIWMSYNFSLGCLNDRDN